MDWWSGRSYANANVIYTAYDEDIDGFQFSRTRSKRIQAKEAAANAATAPARPVATEGTSTSDTGITVKVPSKRKKGSSAATATATATNENESTSSQAQPPRRRSARLSGDKETVAPITASTSAAVPIPHDSTETAKRTKQRPKSTSSSKEVEKEAGNRQPAGSPPLVNEIHIEKKRTATKIALPFADTPIIQRNKDMRKNSGQGHRRSSNGMRGRRASSLIEENKSNGTLLVELRIYCPALSLESILSMENHNNRLMFNRTILQLYHMPKSRRESSTNILHRTSLNRNG